MTRKNLYFDVKYMLKVGHSAINTVLNTATIPGCTCMQGLVILHKIALKI